jgi:hypothetical protein
MRIAYNNYIDNLTTTTLTSLTESPTFPLINVQDQRLSMRFHTFASVTAQTVTVDFGTAMSISTAAVMAHNFTSSCTVTISANTTDSWPGATSKTITYNAGMMLNFFAPVSYQYWQFSLDDQTNTDGFLSMGRLWLGDYITIDPSSEVDFTVIKKRSDRVIHGRGQQKFASIGIGWKEIKLSFPDTNYTMINAIDTMFDIVGKHSAFIFCNFDDLRSVSNLIEPCYVTIENDIQFKHVEGRKFKYDISLQEEL